MLWAQLTAVGTTRRARLTILARDLLDADAQVAPLVQASQRRYVLLVQSMFALTAAMATPLAILRRTGTLAAHLSRQRTPGSDVVEALRRDVVPAIRNSPDDIARVAVGQRGELVLASLPGARQAITVHQITPVATAEDGRNFFRVEARVDADAVADADAAAGTRGASTAAAGTRLRPGMEGVAKVRVGEEKLLWIWTHRLTDTVALALWRWWP